MINKQKIFKILKKKLSIINPNKVFVFGSIIEENFNENSDIDIVVILNKKGFSKDYGEIIENKKIISHELSDLRKEVPIDLLVYTIDEWDYLQNSGSIFFKEIKDKGLKLI